MPSVEFDSWWKLSPDPKLPHLLPKQHSACYPTVTGPLLWGSQSPCFSGFPEAGKQGPNITDCTGEGTSQRWHPCWGHGGDHWWPAWKATR